MAKVGRVILEIKELGGLNTTAPRGFTLQPFECVNVRFDRTGGYANQPDSVKLSNTLELKGVWWAGRSDELFVQTSTDVKHYQSASFNAITGTSGTTTTGLDVVGLNPQRMLLMGGSTPLDDSTYLTPDGVSNVVRTPTAVTFWNGSGSPPSGPYWRYVANATSGVFDEATETTQNMTVFLLGASGSNASNWYTSFNFGKGSANPQSSAVPAVTGKYDIRVSYDPILTANAVKAYFSQDSATVLGNAVTVFAGEGNQFNLSLTDPYGDATQNVFSSTANEGFLVFGRVSTYHNSRVWVAVNPPSGALVSDGTLWAFRSGATVTTDPLSTQGNVTSPRLYYSEVVGSRVEPTWLSDLYIDPPLKVSDRVIGFASVGRYLYIFGNRELLILSGNSDADFAIESLGDSIGAVRQGTIASLGGSVYWVSDSGIMAASAGQVTEVGGDVRWTVSQMNQTNLTATVDFRLELYILTDGATTLVFDAREKKWSTRTGTALSAGNYRLVYGGGTPYALGGASSSVLALYNENDATGTKLTATVIWGDFENGSWDLRKTLSQITFGGQVSSGSFILRNHSFVDGVALIENQNTLTPSSIGKVSFVCVDSNGVQVSGNVFRVGFHFRPNDGNEGVVRGPIQVYGEVKGEEQR